LARSLFSISSAATEVALFEDFFDTMRDYLHVEDHCRGILTVLRHGQAGEAYNLGADLQVSGRELAKTIASHFDLPEDRITFITDRPGHDYRYHVDSGKAEALGWERQWTLNWYAEQTDWWKEMRARPELESHFQNRYGTDI
jgi:dTDP-glucose 4,6-dehydratase